MSNQTNPQAGAGGQPTRPRTPVNRSTSNSSMVMTPPQFYGGSGQPGGRLPPSTSNSSMLTTPPRFYGGNGQSAARLPPATSNNSITSHSSIQQTPPSAYRRNQSPSPPRQPPTQYSYASPGQQQAARAGGEPNPLAKADGTAPSFGSFKRAQQGGNNGQPGR